ncbi:hypothetical protein ElyMa_006679900 [Elysia marginata]|uniref:Uncharacterized protein n=1 Tax=Elysia marginata TaxID=1093978 RepID=A0AAV4ISP0_9GAST|nr:hypothetical protein ElyMa_006679900 [Elysia marginata]
MVAAVVVVEVVVVGLLVLVIIMVVVAVVVVVVGGGAVVASSQLQHAEFMEHSPEAQRMLSSDGDDTEDGKHDTSLNIICGSDAQDDEVDPELKGGHPEENQCGIGKCTPKWAQSELVPYRTSLLNLIQNKKKESFINI